jgi:hypothetical protein
MKDHVAVLLGCNDADGNPDDRLAGVEIGTRTGPGPHLALEAPTGDVGDGDGDWPFTIEPSGFDLDGEEFRSRNRRRHVGNIHWDRVEMIPAEAARFLDVLRARGWTATEGSAGLMRKWSDISRFVARDLTTEEA